MTLTPADSLHWAEVIRTTPIGTRIDIVDLTAVEIGQLSATTRGLEVGWEDNHITLTKVSGDARPVAPHGGRHPHGRAWVPPKWRR